jgi:hypothetical protein
LHGEVIESGTILLGTSKACAAALVGFAPTKKFIRSKK